VKLTTFLKKVFIFALFEWVGGMSLCLEKEVQESNVTNGKTNQSMRTRDKRLGD
jgi:hypothetical protein